MGAEAAKIYSDIWRERHEQIVITTILDSSKRATVRHRLMDTGECMDHPDTITQLTFVQTDRRLLGRSVRHFEKSRYFNL